MPHQYRRRNIKLSGRDRDELKQKRIMLTSEIRKQQRDEGFRKRRFANDLDEQKQQTESIMTEMIEDLQHPDLHICLIATRELCNIFTKEEVKPLDFFIDKGITGHLMKFLESSNCLLQYEATYTIATCLAYASRDQCVKIASESVPTIVGLLSSPEHNIREIAVWALGHISGAGAPLKNKLVTHEIVESLLEQVETDEPKTYLLSGIVWTLANVLSCLAPPTPIEVLRQILPFFKRHISNADSEIVNDILWALCYVTRYSNDFIEEVVITGFVPHLINCLESNNMQVLIPALRSIANIVTGNDTQTQSVVDHGGVLALGNLLQHCNIDVQRDVAWALSNLAAGTSDQIEALINGNIIGPSVNALTNRTFTVQKEVAWMVKNLTASGTNQQTLALLEAGVLPPLCNLLACNDTVILQIILDGIDNILEVADTAGLSPTMCRDIIIQYGLDKIRPLMQHEDHCICKSARDLAHKL